MRPLPLIGAVVVLIAAWLLRRRTSRLAVALMLVAAASLAVYGSSVITLPNLEDVVRGAGPRLGAWTYALVALLAFLESGAFVGLVAPGEFAVIFGGFVAGQGLIDPLLLTLVVVVAALAGDVTSYLLGRRLGRAFLERHGARLGVGAGRLAALEAFYRNHGRKTIVLGRFVGVARSLSPFVAGTSRMPFRRFVVVDAPAVVAWSATFVAVGYVFWASFDRAVLFAKRGNLALFLVVALVVAVIAAVQLHRRRRRARSVVPRDAAGTGGRDEGTEGEYPRGASSSTRRFARRRAADGVGRDLRRHERR